MWTIATDRMSTTHQEPSTMTYARSIPESAPAPILQERAAMYAKFARDWRELAGSQHHLDMARDYQELAAHWYALARESAAH